MVKNGFLSVDELDLALTVKLEFSSAKTEINAPHFVMYVKNLLEERYGPRLVEQGGLRITTSLDLTIQEKTEDIVERQITSLARLRVGNGAALVTNPKTGEILAMVGSRGYFDDTIDGKVNVTLANRQPGSSFKPIVYATAFNKGFTPDTVLYDVNTSFINYDGKDYEPKNYNLKENGPVTIRTALAGSLNIPAVKTIHLAGIDNVIVFAKNLGYTTLTDPSTRQPIRAP